MYTFCDTQSEILILRHQNISKNTHRTKRMFAIKTSYFRREKRLHKTLCHTFPLEKKSFYWKDFFYAMRIS